MSVVIPAYGPTPHLATLLESLQHGTLKAESIVVSHSGAHDPSGALKVRFPEVRFIHSDARLFAGEARNRGAELVDGEVIAFCDSDVLPTSDWLERLVSRISGRDHRFVVGAVGMASTGGYWGTVNWLCEFSEQAPWRAAGAQLGGASCNMAVRRSHFRRAGGFPEGRIIGEDALLFSELRELGLEQWFEPSCLVSHFNRAGVANMAKHQWLHGRHFVVGRRLAELPGTSVIRGGWLVPLLPLVKLGRILGRLCEGGPARVLWGLMLVPGLLAGVAIWGAGVLVEYARPTRA